MVESSRAKINFLKLTSQELSTKIALLVSNQERIIFWKTSPRYFEGIAHSFSAINNKIFLKLEKVHLPIRVLNETICLNFTINAIDYFLRGKVIDQLDAESFLQLELEDHCFRAEKRSRERLLTYPVYDVYAYIKFKKKSQDNVIFFNRGDQQNRDFFTEIDNLQKNKLAMLSDHLNLTEEEDLVGFRVEDLSSNGMSFFASTKEKELVLDTFTEPAFSIILNFEMQIFNLENAMFVYKIHYINSQFQGVPMYKIGISFKQSPALKRKIEEISGITVDLIDYQKEFEEFIKNE